MCVSVPQIVVYTTAGCEKLFDPQNLGMSLGMGACLSQRHPWDPGFQGWVYLRGRIGHCLCTRALSCCSFSLASVSILPLIAPKFGVAILTRPGVVFAYPVKHIPPRDGRGREASDPVIWKAFSLAYACFPLLCSSIGLVFFTPPVPFVQELVIGG